MKREQLIVVGLIVVVGLAVAFFGRTKPTPEDALQRMQNAVIQRKVAVLVFVDLTAQEHRKYRDVARRAVSQTEGGASLIVLDKSNPVERESLKQLPVPPGDEFGLAVIGLDGKTVYTVVGQADPARVAKAIEEGLARPPVKIRIVKPGEHVH